MRKTKGGRGRKRAASRIEVSVREKRVASTYSIKERIAGAGRGEREHIIYLGEMVERVMGGEFGAILEALTAGRISMELTEQKTSGRSSDYHMGRASMGNDLWHDLEQYVLDKDKCMAPLPPDREAQDEYSAREPEPLTDQYGPHS